ncbi:hypothetical protein [Kineosporia sp. A_224]|uniref:hypothetical protein n=1 Tax=Kineosporia sp. A_224 TaxID=1962180 RepID=UPI000B4BCEDC|nr:hypothetical protein [Kineosporia sp. A_224]
MPAAQHELEDVERRGFTVRPGALTATQVHAWTAVLDRAQTRRPARGVAEPGRRLHLPREAAGDPALADLLRSNGSGLRWALLCRQLQLRVPRLLVRAVPDPAHPWRHGPVHWLTDVTAAEHATMLATPSGHRLPPGRPGPAAAGVLLGPGDALLLDRRTWPGGPTGRGGPFRTILLLGPGGGPDADDDQVAAGT